MNKKALKKAIPWSEVRKKLNLTPDSEARIAEHIRMYDLMNEIRDAKKEKEYTNEQISQLSGIPRPEVSKILNGKTNVSILRLSALARALGKELIISLK